MYLYPSENKLPPFFSSRHGTRLEKGLIFEYVQCTSNISPLRGRLAAHFYALAMIFSSKNWQVKKTNSPSYTKQCPYQSSLVPFSDNTILAACWVGANKRGKNTCARTWSSKRGGGLYREHTVHVGKPCAPKSLKYIPVEHTLWPCSIILHNYGHVCKLPMSLSHLHVGG